MCVLCQADKGLSRSHGPVGTSMGTLLIVLNKVRRPTELHTNGERYLGTSTHGCVFLCSTKDTLWSTVPSSSHCGFPEMTGCNLFLSGLVGGSVGKGSCCQDWWPGFNPWGSGGRRKVQTPKSWPLCVSARMLHPQSVSIKQTFLRCFYQNNLSQ